MVHATFARFSSITPAPHRAFSVPERRVELQTSDAFVTARTSRSLMPVRLGRPRPFPVVFRECDGDTAQSVFLWQGALLEPFVGALDRSLPDRVQRSTPLHIWRSEPPNARPRPLTSATTEVRLLGQAPLTRFCNLSTRSRTHQRTAEPHSKRMLSLAPMPCSTEAEPSCEQYDTEVPR